MPVWALIFISMAIGLIVGLLLTVGSVIAANAEKKRLRKEIRSTKNELNRMRNVSIEEDFDEEKLPAKTESSDETKTNEAT